MARRLKKADPNQWFGWELYQGDVLLGRLFNESCSQPWFSYTFEETKAFLPLRPLFEREYHCLNFSSDDSQWQQAFDEIDALKLKLKTHPFTQDVDEIMDDFLIHIHGNEASIRY